MSKKAGLRARFFLWYEARAARNLQEQCLVHDDTVVHGDHAIGLHGDAGSLSTGIERGHVRVSHTIPSSSLVIRMLTRVARWRAASFALTLVTTADSFVAADASRRTVIVALLLPGSGPAARLAITAMLLTALHNNAIRRVIRGDFGYSPARRSLPTFFADGGGFQRVAKPVSGAVREAV